MWSRHMRARRLTSHCPWCANGCKSHLYRTSLWIKASGELINVMWVMTMSSIHSPSTLFCSRSRRAGGYPHWHRALWHQRISKRWATPCTGCHSITERERQPRTRHMQKQRWPYTCLWLWEEKQASKESSRKREDMHTDIPNDGNVKNIL